MAEGIDRIRRSPRWLNCLVCSAGLLLAACFIWRVLSCQGASACATAGLALFVSRMLAVAVLPFLLFVTVVCQTARRTLQ
jgi:hypothetical protein